MQKIQRTRARHGILATNFAVLMLNYADRAIIGVAAPLIIAEFGFSKASFGWILAAFAFTYSPFGFIGGFLADRFGPRNVMGWAIIVWSTFTALTAAGVGFVSLIIIRLLFGIGEGPQATVSAKLMHNWFPKRELGSAVGIVNAATPLGGAIGTPVVVGIMAATQGNWRLAFILLGALGILFAVGWFVLVRDTPGEHRRTNDAEVAYITQDSRENEHQLEAESTEAWWTYLKLPAVWATAIAFFGYSWILWTFLSWFPTYLVQERGIELEELAVAGAIPWIGGCIGLGLGGIFTDWLVRKTGNAEGPRRWTVVVCLGLTAVLFGLIGTVTTLVSAVILMTIVIFFLYFTGAQYWVIVAEAVPSSRYGSVSGAVQTFATTASILAPLLTGYVLDSSAGWGGTFTLAAGIALLGALLLAIFGRKNSLSKTAVKGAA